MKMKIGLTIVLVLICLPIVSYGWDINVWGPDWGDSPYPVLFCLPNGNGDALPTSIGVRVLNDYGNPIVGIPADEVRLYIGLGVGHFHQSRICGGGWIEATGPTNSNGVAEFPLGPFQVYGVNSPASWHVKVKIPDLGWKDCLPNDSSHNYPVYKLYFLSPDFDYSSDVGLTDVGFFSNYFNNQTYDIWCDFNGDGFENVADVAIFSESYGASCGGD